MKKKKFGMTWWGEAWINAMECIDYNENRLPRGRSYANCDRVKQIKIEDGVVFGKVQGSRPYLYKIEISIKKFSRDEIQRITEIIASNPLLGSELSIGRLPEIILKILDENGIFLFPKKWQDIEADCSCPDWANPCKHLAAVYYIIANEIDKDPFIIFNLKGLPTSKLIAASGIIQQEEKGEKKDLFIPYQQVTIREIPAHIEPPSLSFQRLDIDSFFSLLPEYSLFYSKGDFKKILLSTYKKITERIELISINEDTGISFKGVDLYLVHTNKDVFFFVSPSDGLFLEGKEASIKVPVIKKDRIVFVKRKGRIVSTKDVFDLFISLPMDISLDNHSQSSRFLNLLSSIALSLVRAYAFIPEVRMKEGTDFSIRWLPIEYEEGIKGVIESVSSIMPINFSFRKEDLSILIHSGIYEIISMMITHIVHSYGNRISTGWWDKDEDFASDRMYEVFFKGKIYKGEKFEERNTAKAISNWIERLFIRKRDISPVIRIESNNDDNFKLYLDVEDKKDPLSPFIPLSKLFEDKDKPIFSSPLNVVKTEVLRQIVIAGEYIPHLKDVLSNKGEKPSIVSSSDMAHILIHALGMLKLLGIKVIIPSELKKLVSPRLTIKAGVKKKVGAISYLSLKGLLNFSWEIAIGDITITREEFLKMVKESKGIVKFKDQYIILKPEEVKAILEKLSKPLPRMSSTEILHSLFVGEEQGIPFNPDAALKKVMEDLTKIEDIGIPISLKGNLRPYQERGFKWLYSNLSRGFGLCLADDMGLGKTIQVLTLILKLKEEDKLKNSPVLVICPTTLVGNWQKECERFAPNLKILIYHGIERSLMTKGKDVIITTFGMLRKDIKKFEKKNWNLMVVDEAQNIKNPDTDQTKAVKSLAANSFIAMSGTPVENRLTELWSIFDLINKGYLDNLNAFQRKYATPIEKYRDKEQIERLKRAVSPFVLRRLKTDKTIISDLPEKNVFDEYIYLTKEQTALYQQVIDKVMRGIEKSYGIERKGLIFKLITNLKQVCNHPVLYSKRGKPLKNLSGKAEKAMDIITKILVFKEKALVFTQYKEMGNLLVEMIKGETKEEPLFFHGGLTRMKRDKMIDEFQGGIHPLMIVSLKAGGLGLNLTAATNVIHYDLWWNPAVEDQATDRAYRIGQTRDVVIHRLITIGTFEEKIDEMLKAKKELANIVVSAGEKWITELSNKELKEMFSLRRG